MIIFNIYALIIGVASFVISLALGQALWPDNNGRFILVTAILMIVLDVACRAKMSKNPEIRWAMVSPSAGAQFFFILPGWLVGAVFLFFSLGSLGSGLLETHRTPNADRNAQAVAQNDRTKLLVLTPREQKAADRDEALLEIARRSNGSNGSNGPDAPSVTGSFPGAIAISNLEAGCSSGKMHVVKKALAGGADVNQKCIAHATALHTAAAAGHMDIVKLLVAFDADVQATDEQGKTATDLAKANKHRDIAQYLQLQFKAPAKKIPDKKTSGATAPTAPTRNTTITIVMKVPRLSWAHRTTGWNASAGKLKLGPPSPR